MIQQVLQMNTHDLYEYEDTIIMSDLLEDFDAVHLHQQQQDPQNDDEQFLGTKNGGDYEKEMKAFIDELDQQQQPTNSEKNRNEVEANFIQQSIKNEFDTEQQQYVRNATLQQQMQQRGSSEASALRQNLGYFPQPPHFYQNLYQIKEGMYSQQQQNQMPVSHYRSCSDSASNSTIGLPKIMSPELSQTPPIPQFQSPLGFGTPAQIHRRARSEQLQFYGGSDNELNQFFQQIINNCNDQGPVLDTGSGQLEPAYIDAGATHAALGHVYGPRTSHRRIHSYDDAHISNPPSSSFQQPQILQSPSAEYVNPRMHPSNNLQGQFLQDFPLSREDADVATLQYTNLGSYKQHLQELQIYPTSKKSSVQKRDKQLSPKSLKRVVANRESAKRSRDRKEKYRRDMEEENQILKDTLQYLDTQIQQRQAQLSDAKQKNELLRQAVQQRLYIQRGNMEDKQQQHRDEQHKSNR
eukprot:TRINITY_DN4448_c0_g2_i1.p3 TRINITY_DN4448_c0_g2~~TRINITY_DN4448_c0_g2_i1.p3  ORF type:complete len:466 (+),score=27.14 TRINITY_DN4448_c0_g2_i1:173-1570(+)